MPTISIGRSLSKFSDYRSFIRKPREKESREIFSASNSGKIKKMYMPVKEEVRVNDMFYAYARENRLDYTDEKKQEK